MAEHEYREEHSEPCGFRQDKSNVCIVGLLHTLLPFPPGSGMHTGHFIPRLCIRPEPSTALSQDLSFFQPPSTTGMDAQIFTGDKYVSTTTIKANSINSRPTVPL